METLLATSALVCDDDAVLRTVISQLLAESGYTVTSQADGVEPALFEVEHTGADIVILDLALRSGDGEELLALLHERHPHVRVVVFSSFAGDPEALLQAGATAVVDKPDFVRLEEIVRRLRTTDLNVAERRRSLARPLTDLDPPPALTVSGLEPWVSFDQALDGLRRDDAVLVFDVAPSPSLVDVWDDVFRQDYRLAVARAAAITRRTQDRVSISPDGLPVMAVVSGHPEAPSALFARVADIWSREVATGVPLCAFGHVRLHRPARELMTLGIAALHDDPDPSRPLRVL